MVRRYGNIDLCLSDFYFLSIITTGSSEVLHQESEWMRIMPSMRLYSHRDALFTYSRIELVQWESPCWYAMPALRSFVVLS
jgi:hypothetical protein